MQILNYTPHPIHIVDGEGNVVRTIESSGLVRLKAETVSHGTMDGVPLSKTVFGEPEGLPAELHINHEVEIQDSYRNYPVPEMVFYIVSQLVKTALPGRSDLLVPAEVVRDEEGRIIGCRSLGI